MAVLNIEQTCFNGEMTDIAKVRKTIAWIFDPVIRAEKGGFIFRAGSEKKNGVCIIHFGMLPAIIAGERMYHYAIDIPDCCTVALTGALNVAGELMLFPDIAVRGKRASSLLMEGEKKRYIALYREFTSLFVTCGLPTDTVLHEPTIQVLGELSGGMFKGKNVGDITAF